MFDSGVFEYIKGKAVVEVAFPVDMQGNPHVNCMLCKYFSRHSDMCQLTKEIVPFPETYIGYKCPIQFEEEENE